MTPLLQRMTGCLALVWRIVGVALLLAVARPAAAAPVYSAGFVTFQYYYNGAPYDFGSLDSVGGSRTTFAAPGGTVFAPNFTVYVSGGQITYTFTGDSQWQPSATSITIGSLALGNGPVIESTSLSIPNISAVTIDPGSTVPGNFGIANIGFDDRSVGVSWGGVSFDVGDVLILDVTGFSLRGSVQPVAEPTSLSALGTGTAGILLARRRRAKASGPPPARP